MYLLVYSHVNLLCTNKDYYNHIVDIIINITHIQQFGFDHIFLTSLTSFEPFHAREQGKLLGTINRMGGRAALRNTC